MKKNRIVSLNLGVGSFGDFVEKFAVFTKERISFYGCVANGHMTIEAWQNLDFASVVNSRTSAPRRYAPGQKSLPANICEMVMCNRRSSIGNKNFTQ